MTTMRTGSRWRFPDQGFGPAHLAEVRRFLAERTEPDKIGAAVLSGSRGAGLGHATSDLDLYLLFHDQRDADAFAGGSRPWGKFKIDATPLTTFGVEAVAAEVADLDTSPIDRQRFGIDELNRWALPVRLVIGSVLHSDERGARALASLDRNALRRVLMVVWAARLQSYLDDVSGTLDSGDLATALGASGDAMRCAGEIALCGVDDLYVSTKFLFRRLARHDCFAELLDEHGSQLFGLASAELNEDEVRRLVELRLRAATHISMHAVLRGWYQAVDTLPVLPAPDNRGPARRPEAMLGRWHDTIALSGTTRGKVISESEAELWALLDGRPFSELVRSLERDRGLTHDEADTFARTRIAGWRADELVRPAGSGNRAGKEVGGPAD
ncbi:hypothetical protein CFN78_02900 [Amycolatopsis antarctica]|uniref:Polymerase nucleotidyl transferase domain-containing protein n=1 Tax=Amycolatopsis antarctica TaxID=1854586 RepID=A0A263DAD4_9PSEU|nr:hypothetical protein [Amycolatopsis antarctica]OZM75129.1 hypothetical protein CFN78_02900 [Amycolatopsis antarctica]